MPEKRREHNTGNTVQDSLCCVDKGEVNLRTSPLFFIDKVCNGASRVGSE